MLLALGFIVFFTFVTVATLRFADVPALQHARTENTASSDSAAEGGAAYAAVNSARSDLTWNCTGAGNDKGTLTMGDGSQVSYQNAQPCNPGNTAVTTTGGSGGHCLLCILNQVVIPPNTSLLATSPVLTAQCPQSKCAYALHTVGGDILINGSIGSSTTMQACQTTTTCPGLARIGLLTGGSFAACGANGCSPTPSTYPTRISDPLASILDPSATVSVPSGCTTWQTCQPSSCPSWSATQGCTASLSGKTTTTLNPGVWNSISVTGQANVIFSPGVYVMTGTFSASGNGIVCAPGSISGGNCVAGAGVTFYLACPGGTVSGKQVAYQACSSVASKVGGRLDFSGNGQVTVSSTSCPAGQIVPNCPGYDGLAVLADPALQDPSVAGCIGGSNCAMDVAGNGKSFNGSVDLRSAGLSIAGGGGESINQGFLIANSVYMSVNGNSASTGLNLSGPGVFSSSGFGGCNVMVLNVYPGAAAALPNPAPIAVIQSQCIKGATTLSGVVDFNYGD